MFNKFIPAWNNLFNESVIFVILNFNIMKNLALLLVISFLNISIGAQEKLKGNKIVSFQDREVTYFNKIIVKDDLKVMLSSGSAVQVNVETDENLQNAITTRVSEGVLEVYINQKIASSKKLLVYVKVADTLLTVETRDNAKIVVESEINVSELNIMAFDKSSQEIICHANNANIIADGTSDLNLVLNVDSFTNVTADQNSTVKLNLKTNLLNCTLNNSGLVKTVGNCKSIQVEAHDNGNFSGKDLLADTISMIALDRSDVAVNAAVSLEVTAENDAEVYIYDNPEIIMKKFSDKAVLFKK